MPVDFYQVRSINGAVGCHSIKIETTGLFLQFHHTVQEYQPFLSLHGTSNENNNKILVNVIVITFPSACDGQLYMHYQEGINCYCSYS